MLTKNFYVGLKAMLTQSNEGTAKAYNGAESTLTKAAIENATYGLKTSMKSMVSNNSGMTSKGVYLGAGTTKETPDDYIMENIITNISATNPSSVSVNDTGEYFELIATFGVTPTTDITISEIGLVIMDCPDGSYVPYLIERTVLETPITIPAYQSKQVTYTIRFNYPV